MFVIRQYYVIAVAITDSIAGKCIGDLKKRFQHEWTAGGNFHCNGGTTSCAMSRFLLAAARTCRREE